jgi:integrase
VKLLDKADERGSWGTLVIKRGLKRDARARTLTLTKSMRDVLKANMARSMCRLVFTDRDDPTEPLSEFVLGSQVRELKKKLNSHADCGLHALRHTFLTRAGEHVRNVRTLQLIAGHANIQTTMRYVHPSRDDVADALSCCDGRLLTTKEAQEDRANEDGSCYPSCGQRFQEGVQVVTTNLTTLGSAAEV